MFAWSENKPKTETFTNTFSINDLRLLANQLIARLPRCSLSDSMLSTFIIFSYNAAPVLEVKIPTQS